jgi:hypothetical protein
MSKKLFLIASIFLSSFFSVSSMACPGATEINGSGFCSSFQIAAQCHCTSSGLPSGMCNNMNLLYDRMVSMFGSLQRACEYQHDTSTQNCIDSWNCYRQGGTTSQNLLCSGTGHSCQ